jgi:hypothetical protein
MMDSYQLRILQMTPEEQIALAHDMGEACLSIGMIIDELAKKYKLGPEESSIMASCAPSALKAYQLYTIARGGDVVAGAEELLREAGNEGGV